MEFSTPYLENLIIYGSNVLSLFLHFTPVFPYICDVIVKTYHWTLENTERGTFSKDTVLYRRQMREFHL